MNSLTPIPSPGWVVSGRLRQQLLPWLVVLAAFVVAAALWQKCRGIVDSEGPGSEMVLEIGTSPATRVGETRPD